MGKMLLRSLIRAYRLIYARQFNARHWSNDVLRSFCHTLKGDVLNVSGGNDGDKQGATYRSYFCAATNYSISNFGGAINSNDISLDLTSSDLPQDLLKKYDVVFSHTVLEHIFDIRMAIKNLCSLSKGIVITVVPFIQSFHHGPWYSDYWRFTPNALVRLFDEHDFDTILLDWNEDFLGNIYIVHVATSPHGGANSQFIDFELKTLGPGRRRTALLSGANRPDEMNSNLAYEHHRIIERIQ